MSYSIPVPPSRQASERELRRRMPPLQTPGLTSRTATASTTASTTASQPQPPRIETAPSAAQSSSDSAAKSAALGGHQRFVLTDHVAFRYLEEDPSTTVLARRQRLEGYELYLVEQWACSRQHPTFIITTYTGDPKDTVLANILSVPLDESAWSPQLRLYFETLHQFHARRRETPLGTLMITNLSSFPSSLTVIPVPEGDVKKNRELFFVNENLKRLGCSGRLGIKLAAPSSATAAKFHQLYRTSDKIPLNSSVIELVKLCQVALVLFGKLEPEYADGLLCDVTEKAINDWWVEFGADFYNVEPHDGILGPTTVAALLGMLMGARNRLSACNAPVSKDVFDIDSTKRAVSHFQKTQHIQRTRRLDRQTVERLRKATAKAASGEGWNVPRAFKSTVAELGGKGGEMLMGITGRDKAGLADVETVDIDRFVDLVRGERAKWLWYAKPRKGAHADMFSRLPGDEGLTSPAEPSNHSARLLKRESTLDSHSIGRDSMSKDEKRLSDGFLGEVDKDQYSKRAALKKATGKIESGTGFGRIKDVVGRRGHQPKPSKDETGRASLHYARSDLASMGADSSPITRKQDTTYSADAISNDTSTAPAGTDTGYHSPHLKHETTFTKKLTETPRTSASTLAVEQAPSVGDRTGLDTSQKPTDEDAESIKPPTVDDSIAGSIYRGVDLTNLLPDDTQEGSTMLRRTQSSDRLGNYHAEHRDNHWWPRHLSFSMAEEAVLTWRSIAVEYATDDSMPQRPEAELAKQVFISDDAKCLHERLDYLRAIDSAWVDDSITGLGELEQQAEDDIHELEGMYFPRHDEYEALREDAHETLSRERAQLQDSLRDVETLGAKLEYEINTLRSKVDDVDDGVTEFERQIEGVEERVRELESVVSKKEGWLHFIWRVATGIGGPPVTNE